MSSLSSIPQKGSLLLAEPFMWDPNFRRSVVLICNHSAEDGTFGLVLNHPLEIRVADLVGELSALSNTIHLGGPVEKNRLMYLHDLGELLENSERIAPGIWLGGDFEQLKFLTANGLVQNSNIRFFVGYAGWDPGQLEEEMEQRTWIVTDADPNFLFGNLKEDAWKKAMELKGDTFSIISEMPEQGSWN